ncbi:hypothetical protein V8J38_16775 (plasmid) [Brevundimonas olei]|uniref:Uncharacterized protein n=1 Tax=Brevundimonas olei TaxID=657642 RepID=A0ABZ2IG10_9CAUL
MNWPFIQDEVTSGDGDGSDFVILNGSSAVSYSYSSFAGGDPESAPLGRYADADRMVEEFEAAVALPLSLPFADDGAWFERVGIRITLP